MVSVRAEQNPQCVRWFLEPTKGAVYTRLKILQVITSYTLDFNSVPAVCLLTFFLIGNAARRVSSVCFSVCLFVMFVCLFIPVDQGGSRGDLKEQDPLQWRGVSILHEKWCKAS